MLTCFHYHRQPCTDYTLFLEYPWFIFVSSARLNIRNFNCAQERSPIRMGLVLPRAPLQLVIIAKSICVFLPMQMGICEITMPLQITPSSTILLMMGELCLSEWLEGDAFDLLQKPLFHLWLS